ncbi:putative DsbA family dithiol-disulfide isomerase [Acinetobacter calcoaceticus]|uniref:Putative DsbA family dithiol-disulfide isomerase n=1 Tax=Acinetobacter calcoaceticus TaxID=471 RepID=A0A4R1XWS4_ACICA|nr:putative DsbA family dithiol-disulfide isomerase [Acinetobacter calcoaceticus]
MNRELHIEVFFDFICPWCLIGKRQLEAALQLLYHSHPDVDVKLQFRGVQLLPHISAQGEPFAAFYLQRLGSIEAVRMRQAQVKQAAAAVGVNIDFTQIARMPNTLQAHRLLKVASNIGTSSQCDQLLERLFAAYFHLAEDLGDRKTLLNIAQQCGFSSDEISTLLDQPNQAFKSGNTHGNGVPYFILDARLGLAGAYPADQLYQAMLDALRTQVIPESVLDQTPEQTLEQLAQGQLK